MLKLTLCLCVLVIGTSFTGCSSRKPVVITRISEVRPADPEGLETQQLSLTKSAWQRALNNAELNQHIRLIELVTSPSGIRSPLLEYRLFDIRRGSLYDLLGLRNADVLVAVSGMVVQRPSQLCAIHERRRRFE